MYKLVALTAMWLALAQSGNLQLENREECVRRCIQTLPDPELRRQEILALEREAARAIQLADATYFRRVYSDDFAGTLSHGEVVNKAGFINAVQSGVIKYQAFNASDIQVHLFRETAIATCVWSARGLVKGQSVSSQMRVIHVYVYGGLGWRVVAGQTSALPPYTLQPL